MKKSRIDNNSRTISYIDSFSGRLRFLLTESFPSINLPGQSALLQKITKTSPSSATRWLNDNDVPRSNVLRKLVERCYGQLNETTATIETEERVNNEKIEKEIDNDILSLKLWLLHGEVVYSLPRPPFLPPNLSSQTKPNHNLLLNLINETKNNKIDDKTFLLGLLNLIMLYLNTIK